MKMTNKRMMEIIKEETERFLTEVEFGNVNEIRQDLDNLVNDLEDQIELIGEAILLASQKYPEQSEKLTRIVTVHNTYIKTLKELSDILQ